MRIGAEVNDPTREEIARLIQDSGRVSVRLGFAVLRQCMPATRITNRSNSSG
jgi:hypothetical protein